MARSRRSTRATRPGDPPHLAAQKVQQSNPPAAQESVARLTEALGALPPHKIKPVVSDVKLDRPSNQATARLAAEILGQGHSGFVVPSARQREAILVAFVRAGYVIYGKAFDIVRVTASIDLTDEEEIRRHLDDIVLYEIKSTSKNRMPEDFRGFFFSLSTAELLVAQNLGSRYRFAFVNTHTRKHIEMTLSELFARSRGIYPSWSIMF